MARPTRIFAPACAAVALLLAACATTFDIGNAARDVTPEQAAGNVASAHGRQVAWGGVIVSARNLADHTQLEVLAYPLDTHNRPQRDTEPVGRFLALHTGYLETANYAAGRLVTVTGKVTGTREGNVGEARYLYPVLAIERIHLWPTPGQEAAEPRFHFGVGVGIVR